MNSYHLWSINSDGSRWNSRYGSWNINNYGSGKEMNKKDAVSCADDV